MCLCCPPSFLWWGRGHDDERKHHGAAKAKEARAQKRSRDKADGEGDDGQKRSPHYANNIQGGANVARGGPFWEPPLC